MHYVRRLNRQEDGRQNLQVTLRFRRTRDCDLALGMKGLLTPERVDDDRRVPLHPEHLDRRIDLADVDETAWTQIIPRKTFAIGANRPVVYACRAR